jgi:hypothetical protein
MTEQQSTPEFDPSESENAGALRWLLDAEAES